MNQYGIGWWFEICDEDPSTWFQHSVDLFERPTFQIIWQVVNHQPADDYIEGHIRKVKFLDQAYIENRIDTTALCLGPSNLNSLRRGIYPVR